MTKVPQDNNKIKNSESVLSRINEFFFHRNPPQLNTESAERGRFIFQKNKSVAFLSYFFLIGGSK